MRRGRWFPDRHRRRDGHRFRARFAELHTERGQIEANRAALAKTTPKPIDPALLDELPFAGDILPTLPPPPEGTPTG